MKKRIAAILSLFAFGCATMWAASWADGADGGGSIGQESLAVASEATVDVQKGAVLISNNSAGDNTFTIYCVTGQQVKVVELSGDAKATVELPKGFYVVKCSDSWSRKIVVR